LWKDWNKINNMSNIKQEIIDAGLYLLEKQLIARTWGNISARIDDNSFYITPSGKAYTDIKEEDLPVVSINPVSYDKNGPKPSSEKGMHAIIYKNRPDVKYIVHTHQLYASAICAEGYSVELLDGTFLPCAHYGLPGTKTLIHNVEKEIIDNPTCNMFLLEKHGTVLLGSTMKEALDRADYLEKECKKKFDKRVKEIIIPDKMDAYLDDYAQMVPSIKPVDDIEALQMVTEKNAAAYLYSRDGKPLNSIDRKLQHFVYKTKYSKLRDKKWNMY